MRISASSEALDRNIPITAHQISLSTSPIGGNIARFAAVRQSDQVYDRDRLRPYADHVEVLAYDLYRDGYRRASEPTTGKRLRKPSDTVEVLTYDTVVLCTARESCAELFDGLTAVREGWAERGIEVVVRAGDCLAPRYLADAIFDGHRIAREIESPDPERPHAIVRERQIWGHTVYPKLGDLVL